MKRSRLLPSTAISLLSALALGCSLSPGGPPAVYLSVSVVDAAGTEHPTLCTQFPVLVGSRVADEQRIGSDFTVRVELTRSLAEVSFVGRQTTQVTYTLQQVESGISGDPFTLAGLQQEYQATVRSGCR